MLIQPVCRLKQKLFVMLVVKTDQDHLDLLEESSTHNNLRRKYVLKVLTVVFKRLFKEALSKWEFLEHALA